MNGFQDRQASFEKKYALDEEARFKALVKRNRKLGLWAAQGLNLEGEDVKSYVEGVVNYALKGGHDEDLLAKIYADFQTAGHILDEKVLKANMVSFLQEALEAEEKGSA